MADISKLLQISAGKHKEVDLNAASTALLVKELKSDTLSEATSAAGVTIDGLAIKDSKLVTADCVVADNLTDGIITNDHISTSAGIVASKLATTTDGYLLIGTTTTGIPTFTALSGDATIIGSGALTIGADKVDGSKIRLANNENLKARNQADSGNINILKVNASDIIELASFPITPSAAPDADYEVANKKYVDDSISSAAVQKVDITLTNNSGAQIDAGSIVCLSQSVAGEIILADADALSTCEGTIGVAVANIANAASGLVRIAGEITVVQDAAFDLGKEVFLSTTAGSSTKTAPSGSGDQVICLGKASDTAKIILGIQHRYEVA